MIRFNTKNNIYCTGFYKGLPSGILCCLGGGGVEEVHVSGLVNLVKVHVRLSLHVSQWPKRTGLILVSEA